MGGGKGASALKGSAGSPGDRKSRRERIKPMCFHALGKREVTGRVGR